MSLEENIVALTKALEANTAALKGSGGGSASSTKPAAGNKPTVKLEQIVTVLTAIKESHGVPAFKEVLKKFGATKSSELKEADYPKVLAAAEAQLEKLNNAAETAGEDDDEL